MMLLLQLQFGYYNCNVVTTTTMWLSLLDVFFHTMLYENTCCVITVNDVVTTTTTLWLSLDVVFSHDLECMENPSYRLDKDDRSLI